MAPLVLRFCLRVFPYAVSIQTGAVHLPFFFLSSVTLFYFFDFGCAGSSFQLEEGFQSVWA